jgi:probable HAF family extracellular repeat protein
MQRAICATGAAFAATSLLLAAGPAAQIPKLDLVELGVLPGGTYSEAYAVNDHGQVVGTSQTGGQQHAALWHDGTMVDLGTLPEGHSSYAFSVNARGQIVGFGDTIGPACDPGVFSACQHAFVWDEGVMTPLRPLAGPFSHAADINDRGHVVGSSTTTSGEGHAVLWADGRTVDLGVLPGDTVAHANAINNRGQIVGWSSGETTRAFIWENGEMRELGTLNGSFGLAVDINKRGMIFGVGDDAGARPPVVWFRDTVGDLGILPGFETAYVSRANDRGQVVGSMATYQGVVAIPVVWDDGRIIQLPLLPPLAECDNCNSANDINNRGTIVGISGGRAVLWTPR